MNTTKEQRKQFVNTLLLQLVHTNVSALLNMSAKVKICSEDKNGNVFATIAFNGVCVNRVTITTVDNSNLYFNIEYYNYTIYDGFEIKEKFENVSCIDLKDNFVKNSGLSF